MAQTNETPPLGAAGLGDNAFPGGNSNTDIATKPIYIQAAIAGLKREFVSECLRIAALKARHGADTLDLGDDLNAERDIRIAVENLREAGRAFRELQLLLKAEGQSRAAASSQREKAGAGRKRRSIL